MNVKFYATIFSFSIKKKYFFVNFDKIAFFFSNNMVGGGRIIESSVTGWE